MYPKFPKVGNELREIQANLILSLRHMKRHPAMQECIATLRCIWVFRQHFGHLNVVVSGVEYS